MKEEILNRLKEITPEEAFYKTGGADIQKNIYTDATANLFTIDASKLLEKGRLIEVRPHTRFVHFPLHRHNYVELVYMCQGSTTHIMDGKDTLVLKEGDLLFLNQNSSHEILPASEDDIAVNFIILPEFFNYTLSMMEQQNILRDFLLSSLTGGDGSFDYLHFTAKNILPVQNLLENMIWTLFDKKTNQYTLIQTTMGLLLMNLSSFTKQLNRANSNNYEQTLILRTLEYIDSHYKSGTLQEISDTLHQPTYYISRLLKKFTGKNFKELLQERKLQQAAFLLSQSTLTTEQVLLSIGYDNSSYFYRIFKEKYQMSPKEYRKQGIKQLE